EAFSYSVSHDLRAPLRGIDGFSRALLEDFGDRLDDNGRHYLERVRAGTQRMGHLIDDLLKLSRVSRADLDQVDVDLSAMSTRILQDFTEKQPFRDITFEVAPGLATWADPRLMAIVMENLLANAWKFTQKTPGARIEVGALPEGEETAFYVRDNGAGFDMAYASKLFGAFQRLHTAQEFEGTGIGLAIVQRIIHRHGGRLWAEGETGRGATFHFTLPR
ncbi:MAG TPA: ATP-binding protein, partial [Holophaga sp.]|nr:ATP-binding protein [Holophaga sp.]